jgi:hypothetical protein
MRTEGMKILSYKNRHVTRMYEKLLKKTIEGGFETGLLRRTSREGEGYQALKRGQVFQSAVSSARIKKGLANVAIASPHMLPPMRVYGVRYTLWCDGQSSL